MNKVFDGSLNYYNIDTGGRLDTIALDTLIRRVVGTGNYKLFKSNDPGVDGVFHVWLSDEEAKFIDEKMDELAYENLDEEYEKLMKENSL